MKIKHISCLVSRDTTQIILGQFGFLNNLEATLSGMFVTTKQNSDSW